MKGQGYFHGLVCVFLLIVPVIGDGFIYEDNTSEDLGHVRNSNGTILWGSLPKGKCFQICLCFWQYLHLAPMSKRIG